MSDLLPTIRASLAAAATTQARRRRRRRAIAPLAGVTVVALSVSAALGWPSTKVDVVEKAEAALTAAPNEILHIRAVQTTDASRQTTETVERWEESDPLRGRIWVRPAAAPTGGTQFAYNRAYYKRIPTPSTNAQQPAGADPVAAIKHLLDSGQIADAGQTTVDGHAARRLQGTIDDAHSRQQVVYEVDPDSYQPVVSKIDITPRVDGALHTDDTMTVTTRYEVIERLPATSDNERLLQVDDGAQTPPHEASATRDAS
jgi:hypothetical protein